MQYKECTSGYGLSVLIFLMVFLVLTALSIGTCGCCIFYFNYHAWPLTMFVVIMLLKIIIEGSSCPWNTIIAYIQLTVNTITWFPSTSCSKMLSQQWHKYCYPHNSGRTNQEFLHGHSTIVGQHFNERDWHSSLTTT